MIDTNDKTPEITTHLVEALIQQQFPKWAELKIEPVKQSGWDNRTFHLGDQMLVRLPSAESYAAKVKIEQKWLPQLASHLPYPIPKPVAMGEPSKIYPWNWSIYNWIKGENADSLRKADLPKFAQDCAYFLKQLYRINIYDAPLAGPHNFYRGGPLNTYDAETRQAISELGDVIDQSIATATWNATISSKWANSPVWIHGDFSVGNILVKDGRLVAVIDFGCMGVGDPACDLVIALTFLNQKSRQIFKKHINLDDDTWMRARGWCLWKALITLLKIDNKKSEDAKTQMRIIQNVLINKV